jgi:hypothetical protein
MFNTPQNEYRIRYRYDRDSILVTNKQEEKFAFISNIRFREDLSTHPTLPKELKEIL